jgi:hypothetical protein
VPIGISTGCAVWLWLGMGRETMIAFKKVSAQVGTWCADQTRKCSIFFVSTFLFFKLPPFTLAGLYLMTQGSSLLFGRRRRYHYVDHAAMSI